MKSQLTKNTVNPFVEPEDAATHFMSKLNSFFQTYLTPVNICLTEVITGGDTRAKDPRMKTAISDGVKDLLRCGKFKVILKEDIPDGSHMLTARFVLAIKSKTDGQIKFKVRYVMRGHLTSSCSF